MTLGLAACGDPDLAQVKNLKEQVQVAYGSKDFKKALALSEKAFPLARKAEGDRAADTLYFAQAISENNLMLHNARATMAALKQEIQMRAGASQNEKKLQPRRTLLIKLAEENGDKITAADQAVAVARGISMGPGKDPQPVYRAETAYPLEQFRQKTEGDVQIAYSLDSAGAVTDARVVKSTPPQVFDEAALESFRKWRFTPMLDKNGQPVSASGLTFTLAFRLGRPAS
jgi:protein TonB